jgi:hypothetical protein
MSVLGPGRVVLRNPANGLVGRGVLGRGAADPKRLGRIGKLLVEETEPNKPLAGGGG